MVLFDRWLEMKDLWNFVDGNWISTKSKFDVYNPATEEVIAKCNLSSAEDVDIAVRAARKAFEVQDAWGACVGFRHTSGKQRAVWLRSIADLVDKRSDELATLETLDCGKSYLESKWDMEDVSACFRYFADQAEKLHREEGEGLVAVADKDYRCHVRHEPTGVVAAVIPWNYVIPKKIKYIYV